MDGRSHPFDLNLRAAFLPLESARQNAAHEILAQEQEEDERHRSGEQGAAIFRLYKSN